MPTSLHTIRDSIEDARRTIDDYNAERSDEDGTVNTGFFKDLEAANAVLLKAWKIIDNLF